MFYYYYYYYYYYSLICLVWFLATARAQLGSVLPADFRNSTFNSTYGHYSTRTALLAISKAKLSDQLSKAVLPAINFERSNWAGNAALLDPFYRDIPANTSHLPAGSLLRVEEVSDPKFYSIPQGLSLSRFLFTTKTVNNTIVPASAFVLWPYIPRQFPNITGVPIVGWGHGSSGVHAECAPSHNRNLWYQFGAPFTLALQGFTVVAPDYAGLGVAYDGEGNFISHQHQAFPAHGNDLIFSVQAAQKAWANLSQEFVLMGHSQGAGAVWAAAEAMAADPVPGYLGGVAASAPTSFKTLVNGLDNAPVAKYFFAAFAAQGMASIFPLFRPSDWFTDIGLRAANLIKDLQACQSVASELYFSLPNVIKPTFNHTWYFDAFDKLVRNGQKPINGPLLVLQGSNDVAILPEETIASVNHTCTTFPVSQIRLEILPNTDHTGTLYSGQNIWLQWIADRFAGVRSPPHCETENRLPVRPLDAYQTSVNYFLEYSLYTYELV